MYDQSKLSELIRFARVDAGSTVIDVYPGDGDWTRLFSDIVGPEGRVYSFVPAEVAHFKNDPVGRMRTLAKEPGRENVEAVSADLVAMPEVTQPADVLWLHLFYHDLHTALIQARGATAAHFNRAVYERLKPGGSYVIVDHAAAVGAGTSDAQSLHRIEPASVREEVEAAGFVLDAESTMLANKDDPHSDQGVRSLDQGRDRSLRLSVREALTGPGADFMSTFKWVQAKPLKTSRQTLLAATKSALDELVWWDSMRLGLLNQSAPPFLPAEWNGSFCAIATDSGPSNFGQLQA